MRAANFLSSTLAFGKFFIHFSAWRLQSDLNEQSPRSMPEYLQNVFLRISATVSTYPIQPYLVVVVTFIFNFPVQLPTAG
jgi:hypothetical protein